MSGQEKIFVAVFRDLAWLSFERRFSSPCFIKGHYGFYLEAINFTAVDASMAFMSWTAKQYRASDIELASVLPFVPAKRVNELVQDPRAVTAAMIEWCRNDQNLPTPFKTWYVHN